MLCISINAVAQRSEKLLEKNWRFHKGEVTGAEAVNYNDESWQKVSIPHDWAIYGPFDRSHDLQEVAITQNGEKKASVKTGRTGGLPYVGIGWYRLHFDADTSKVVNLLFDGAMSEARVYVNGQEACYWPYGYNSFHCEISKFLNTDGKDNVLAIRLENKPQSSRWYPGAGLYRNVHLIQTNKEHVPIWGTQLTTPFVSDTLATVKLLTNIEGTNGQSVRVITRIKDTNGLEVAQKESTQKINHDMPFEQNILMHNPALWSPETPTLYTAESEIYIGDKQVDNYSTRFGVRTIEFIPEKGFYLNGKPRKIQGVCNHHDLGPLGAAVNKAALRHQLSLLKDMGCDAIRTAHNMPAPELVELCDEMGFMMQIEPFDEWDIAKCKNGYHRFFKDWAEKDMVNMLHNYRNNASVIMWSIGNEVPTQCSPEGYKVARFLQDICHREDPTRLVTCGMDRVSCVLSNGFAAAVDIPGFNYRVHRYDEAYGMLPQNFILGSETTSTVSSRGVYKLPVEKKSDATYKDHQSSSYDMEYCSWSNLPDDDFAKAEDNDWHLGQFVWTGFDYLGEPSPYDTDAWPNHSSMFGIIDLASIPKDRYYLYRSEWNKTDKTLHVLPHWNWEGHEGEQIPVYVYTNYPEVEIFVNGKSYGKKHKQDTNNQTRFRLMWNDVVYEPGELKAVAYDKNGNVVDKQVINTAEKAHHLLIESNKQELTADGKDLIYLTISVVDKDGNLVPNAANEINFQVKGAAEYRAAANGDPTCLDLFHLAHMHAFSGKLTAIIQSNGEKGEIRFKASSKGIKSTEITLQSY